MSKRPRGWEERQDVILDGRKAVDDGEDQTRFIQMLETMLAEAKAGRVRLRYLRVIHDQPAPKIPVSGFGRR